MYEAGELGKGPFFQEAGVSHARRGTGMSRPTLGDGMNSHGAGILLVGGHMSLSKGLEPA